MIFCTPLVVKVGSLHLLGSVIQSLQPANGLFLFSLLYRVQVGVDKVYFSVEYIRFAEQHIFLVRLQFVLHIFDSLEPDQFHTVGAVGEESRHPFTAAFAYHVD